LLRIVLSKFVIQKCKRFPPHLNSVSALSYKTQHSCFAGKSQKRRGRVCSALNMKFFTYWKCCGLKDNSSINIYNTNNKVQKVIF